jgi:uncharacterized repeat protein (TIGR03806 family)
MAQSVFLDFNTTGQYTNNFNTWNDAGGIDGFSDAFSEGTTAGIAGAGGVTVFQSSDTTATYKTGSWDFSTNGSTLIFSVMIKANGQTSGNKVQLGIVNTNYNGLNGNAGVSFESFRFVPSSATTWSLREQFRTNNTTAAETVFGTVNVIVGHWYKFVIGLTNTSGSGGNLAGSAAVFDYGSDGLTPGTNAVTFSTAVAHGGSTITVPAVWVGLRAFQNAGIDAWDSFLVFQTNSRPLFTIPLTNTSVPIGNFASFSVLADGPGAIFYSWFTNGIAVGGAAGPSYTTPPVNNSYSNIAVVAANANGSVTNTATISLIGATNMTPVTVAGFNRDIVIENTASGPPFSSAALEFNPGEGTAFYQAGLAGTTYGLAASGAFVSATGDGTIFQFQPYTQNNALVLSSETAVSSGTLTLNAPGLYSRLALIANSASGGGTPNMTLHFNDGSTLVLPYNAQDWFFNPGFALQGVDRINIAGGAADGGANGDPRFYQTTVDLAATLGFSGNKPLSSITFNQDAGANATAIYAISGLPVSSLTTPSVVTLAASNVQGTSATLGGQVTNPGGGEAPVVTLFYGGTDGGSNPAAWAQSVSLGRQSGPFSQGINGLTANATYYFTARAQNSAGTAWAAPSRSFTTVGVTAPAVTNLPASSILASAATFNGQVLSTGGETPSVSLFYGTNNGGTVASAWSNRFALGPQSGAFSQIVSSLSTNTTYYYTAQASNSVGIAWASPSQSFTTLSSNPPPPALAAVLTYHNDNSRQGANTNETLLTLANVNSTNFGKLFSYGVDGYVYAQPLIMTNVSIPGKGIHNVVYVATEHNSLYAFDADDNSGANASPLWQTSFLNPGAGITTVPNGDVGTTDITPEVGITSTPVIDPVTSTIYVVVKTKEPGPVYVQRVHALDLASGIERTSFNSPNVIGATNYPGAGSGDNDGAGHVLWNPLRSHCRSALTLVNGAVYMAFASHGDNGPYHGWMMAYNATNLAQQVGIYNATPNGGLGGFWDGGGGPSVDAQGNLYFQTGNGGFNGNLNVTSTNNYAMSVLKLATTNGIKLVDYFAPSNAVTLSNGDQDLGSSAPIILPDSAGSAAHPHLVVGGGKTAPVYLMDRDNMGRFNGASGINNIVQQFYGSAGGDRNTTPAFFNNTMYMYDAAGKIGAFTINNGLFNTTPVETPDTFANKGGATVSISANGTSNAIAWVINNSGGQSPATPAVLRAYNATNLTQKLYASDQNPGRDSAGSAVKFIVPTIANGKVYVGAQYSLSVYAAGQFLPTPLISPNGGIFTNSVTVSLSDSASGVTIYYTLDGTAPTTGSILYTGPFVLTNSAGVQAIATKPGYVNSGIASAGFINSSAIGNGTGLLGSYWSNTTAATFGNPAFSVPATLVRTDAVVNFNWGNGSPDPTISADDFTARWTGMVQPQYSETYTFTTTTDDGVRLWVNGQLIIDQWVDQGPTPWSGTIALKAQQRYNIRMDYYENAGGAVATLSWSSPSSPQAIIPTSQMYPVTNPPPVVVLTAPTNTSVYTASASVTVSANAAAQFNGIGKVDFYANTSFLGTVSNAPYALTATGIAAGSYVLKAVAYDTTGLAGTSAPVNITVAAGTGASYGLSSRPVSPAFYNMPGTFNGSMPPTLSQTGVFTNTPSMFTAGGLIPYNVIAPLWSDGALKTRWISVPNSGAPYTPDEQIAFAPTGEWSFPSGTIFVKHFELNTDQSNPAGPKHRLETRLLVRDQNATVYGVTYKWRSDNSDADLLTTSLSEAITITNADHSTWTQTWYYPSPADCLTCHTPAANYVLGVKTRQLDSNLTYDSTHQTDNQLRTFNRLGMFYPAINETNIATYTHLVEVTNTAAPLVDRARSYLDANCAQCHRPGGSGPGFDGRWDTPLNSQSLIYGPLTKGDLGYDNAYVVVPNDIWRSILYQRANSQDSTIKMPPLARNLVDTNSLDVVAAWINSLPGVPALAPPLMNPAGGTFYGPVTVALQPPAGNATIHYTLDGSLPNTGSAVYSSPLTVSNSLTLRANAFAPGFTNSVATNGVFNILPGIVFASSGGFTNGAFQMVIAGTAGKSYVLQASSNLVNWIPISTTMPPSTPFTMSDPAATNFQHRFYRAVQLP